MNHRLHGLLAVWMMPLVLAGPEQRPNLIVIVTDDQRRDQLSLTGNPVVRTPHLDRLAADGVFFDQATVSSAICTPSRVSMFLGQYERRHGVNFNSGTTVSSEAWAMSYPVLLRRAGYFTGYIGKNHTPVGERGYESGIMEQSFDYWFAAHKHLHFYSKESHPVFAKAKADTQVEILDEGTRNFLSGDAFSEGSKSFLERRPTDRPFALTVAFNVPHGQSTGKMELRASDPELYRTLYREEIARMALPENYLAKSDIRNPRLPADLFYPQFRQTEYDYVNAAETLRERMIRQYQTIAGVDAFVGRMRAALQAAGLAENTVIVFISDHGLMLGEFGLGGKALNYDACLRVPLIVMDPRAAAEMRGRRTAALAQSVDLAPTLLDLAGLETPAAMRGRSLRPMLLGRSGEVRDHAFAENLWSNYFGNPRCESVRSAEWKYIRYLRNDHSLFAEGGRTNSAPVTAEHVRLYREWLTASIDGETPVYEELFHLATDPGETTNLAAVPTHAAQLRRLRGVCDSHVRDAAR